MTVVLPDEGAPVRKIFFLQVTILYYGTEREKD
jgi:hypothetical protein